MSTIPNEDEGLMKRQLAVESEPESENSVSQEAPVDNQSEQINEETAGGGSQDVIRIDQPIQTQNSTGVQSQQDIEVRDQSQTQSHLQPQTQPQVVTTGTICPFYKKGICRYGASGRGCSGNHPKPCKKLIQHGIKAPNGCSLGRANCDKFHPKMCHDSLTKGQCYNTDCKSKHVTGTKREQPEEKVVGKERQKKDSRDTIPKKLKNGTSDTGDFLGVLHCLKVEMLEAMDIKLAQYISAQTPAPTTVNYMRTATPMMKMAESAPYMNHGLHGTHHSMAMQTGQPWGMAMPGQPVYLQSGMNQMPPMFMPLRSGALSH